MTDTAAAGIYVPEVTEQAERLLAAGQLVDAKAALEPMTSAAYEQGPREPREHGFAPLLATGIRVDLALGYTAAAQRACDWLQARETYIAQLMTERLGPSRRAGRSFTERQFPRQATREFLAATQRLGQALDSVDAEALHAYDPTILREGRIGRLRLELAIRARNFGEIVRTGTLWRADVQRAVVAAQRARPTEDIDEWDIDSIGSGERARLLIEWELARAKVARRRAYSTLLSRERKVISDLIAQSPARGFDVIEWRLALGRAEAAAGQPDIAKQSLELALAAATRHSHRDLESRLELALAEIDESCGNIEAAREHAQRSVASATSQDGGPALAATRDAAFKLLLDADQALRRRAPRLPLAAARDQRRETIILVHGTFAAPSPDSKQWFEAGSDFVRALDAHLQRAGANARCWAHLETGEREFFWTGANSWVDRTLAARDLADYIRRLSPQWRCHLIAHSHGGNVCREALRILDATQARPWWDGRIVTMGTPFLHQAEPEPPSRLWEKIIGLLLWAGVAAVLVTAVILLPWWATLLGAIAIAPLLFLAVFIGLFFTGGWQQDTEDWANDDHKAQNDRLYRLRFPPALAISSEHDEALRLMQMVLAMPEPLALRHRPPFREIIAAVHEELHRIGAARGRRRWRSAFRVAPALVREVARHQVLRAGWKGLREAIAGLSGLDGGLRLTHVDARPRNSDELAWTYEALPDDLAHEAVAERGTELTGVGGHLLRGLDKETLSGAEVESLVRSLTFGKLVHSFYYRNTRCIARIAAWLAVRYVEPPDAQTQIEQHDYLEFMQTIDRVLGGKVFTTEAPNPWTPTGSGTPAENDTSLVRKDFRADLT